jgi:hypothetical protein
MSRMLRLRMELREREVGARGQFRKWPDSEALRRDPVVTAIKVEIPFRCEAFKVPGVFAVLRHCVKLFCVWFAAFAEECFGRRKPGPTNEMVSRQ